eukprot:TRINITY_DN22593_c0_g1_i1.p1 TRINITY_DN22593_c0_g1~~TRINITY_DN22593_c0_g1_i1.p1  ORF type:complete len:542 (+),score=140.34 TRINITY_DN22593_c0_g1_i1:75-1628(+)
MARCVPFRHRPTVQLANRIVDAQQARFLVVAEPGPTKFVLRAAPPQRPEGTPFTAGQRVRVTRSIELEDEVIPAGAPGLVRTGGTDQVEVEFPEFLADISAADLELRGNERKHTVEVGAVQRCSCMGSGEELCLHVLFVMLRVYGVSPSSELLWQTGLTDSEIAKLLQLRQYRRAMRRQQASVAAMQAHIASLQVERREVDDVCPICYDDMDPAVAQGRPGCLTWCRRGCGNNVHFSCMRAWAQHHSERVTCPNCRADWVMPLRPATPPSGAQPCPPDPAPSDPTALLLAAAAAAPPAPPSQRRPRRASAPQAPARHDAVCRHCGEEGIRGVRFRCALCAAYDLCGNCVRDPLVHGQHPFEQIARPGAGAVPCDRSTLSSGGGSVIGTGLSGAAPAVRPGGYATPGEAAARALQPSGDGPPQSLAFSVAGTRALSMRQGRPRQLSGGGAPRRAGTLRSPARPAPEHSAHPGLSVAAAGVSAPGVQLADGAPRTLLSHQSAGRLMRGRPPPLPGERPV